MSIDFKEFFHILKTEVIGFAKATMSDYLKEATVDGVAILDNLEINIKKWSKMLIDGDIDEANFQSLLLGEKDLLKMKALTKAGITAIRMDKFKNDVFNLIASTVITMVKLP